jgi:hypothetical protein
MGETVQKSIVECGTPLPTSTIKEAVFLQGEADSREQEIAEIRTQALEPFVRQIEELQAEADDLRARGKRILAECVAVNHLEEGLYKIQVKARTTRTIDPARFAKAFPSEFMSLATIPVQKAEAMLGKMQIAPYCEYSRGPETYEVAYRFKDGK